ncbi:MAG: hypothetical protein QOI64_2072, partial [Solirubrobacteraceae bacterium]|nr:hypothetical protein [Solirubrobacteraceae bacterium]
MHRAPGRKTGRSVFLGGGSRVAGRGDLDSPPMTYSIVARDPETGELGVAVQSHWFSVGQIVPSAEAGVGAVANQSVPEPSFGPRVLDLLR